MVMGILWRLRLQGLREIEFVSLVGVDRRGDAAAADNSDRDGNGDEKV